MRTGATFKLSSNQYAPCSTRMAVQCMRSWLTMRPSDDSAQRRRTDVAFGCTGLSKSRCQRAKRPNACWATFQRRTYPANAQCIKGWLAAICMCYTTSLAILRSARGTELITIAGYARTASEYHPPALSWLARRSADLSSFIMQRTEHTRAYTHTHTHTPNRSIRK